MGLFDIFKKKKEHNNPVEADEPKQQEMPVENTAGYLGDLEKTDKIYNLVRIPKVDRDEKWQDAFLDILPEASFQCGEPQVAIGPDGFPYVQLFLPEPGKRFQCYVIARMKDDFLLEKGYGVVINPTDDGADWVLSYGDVLNLQLNNRFYGADNHPFVKAHADEVVQEDENVMIGHPNESILPKETRNILREFLKRNGVKEPKVLMMMRQNKHREEPSQDLAFNIIPEYFENEERYRSVMGAVAWFLPDYYSYVGLDERTFKEGFMPL